jgi:hypothetical protein
MDSGLSHIECSLVVSISALPLTGCPGFTNRCESDSDSASDLCSDQRNLSGLLGSLGSREDTGSSSLGDVNEELLRSMLSAPTDGPFYMFNLIRYREWAVYPDGRETDLTGREANALYAPTELPHCTSVQCGALGPVRGDRIVQCLIVLDCGVAIGIATALMRRPGSDDDVLLQTTRW